ncbi:carboxylic ester hydrolase [Favolaschia claudopus]|uniref:Carboxylic ester hydrolase n=1 Tax=Favolaschia claudopus TaxID=2862362 RepID=A0AAW0ED77_9AGAR
MAASMHVSAQFQEPFTAASIVAATYASAQFPKLCDSLASKLSIPNATISSTTFVAAGTTLDFPEADPTCGDLAPPQLISADMCRVMLTVTTSARSHIVMETWLPSNWTGRFLATGNYGIRGCIQFDDMAYGASLGFATTGSDNGHSGQNGTEFLNNPDIVDDFVFRALVTSVHVGKDITRAFFGRAVKKSYFLGCGTGGLQGWRMAQDFPDEFDGIVVTNPALAWTGLLSWNARFFPLIQNAGADFPPRHLWPVVDDGILAQCDGLDGALDGILEEPSRCDFKPEALICAPGQTASCLTSQQAATVRAVFSPLFARSSFMYPALQFGPRLLEQVFEIYGGAQFVIADDWYRFAVFNDPTFNTTIMTPDDILFAQRSNPGGINTFSGDISKFKKRGSKILHYQGQSGAFVSSHSSNQYYEMVAERMRMQPAALDEFYRFFRISGMDHCAGGPGQELPSVDPDQNAVMSMVRWVEEGVAPNTILDQGVGGGFPESALPISVS